MVKLHCKDVLWCVFSIVFDDFTSMNSGTGGSYKRKIQDDQKNNRGDFGESSRDGRCNLFVFGARRDIRMFWLLINYPCLGRRKKTNRPADGTEKGKETKTVIGKNKSASSFEASSYASLTARED
ncbi:hypothetical protein RUM44_002986 [Polyplax serrata]|uniref:Uncharacterized protein n=1 Tax=Polyplax serrata TaxID=468196 RepID=A0ABR1AXC8_POLSC